MTRPLRVVPTDDPAAVLAALREALAGGPAILPGNPRTAVPSEVEQRIAVVIETSGSTGVPKRVALGADALLASAAASESSLGGPGQWLLALPTHYIAGINVLVRSIAAGVKPVYFGTSHFDAATFAEASGELDAAMRFTSLVPAQLARVVDAADDNLALLAVVRRFDRILVGGQATPPALLARAFELGLNLGDPAATETAFVVHDGARWYRTGDTGEIEDGTLRVTGRLDGLIISGGEKVSLDAIESVVRAMDGLADAVAVRSPSAEWGEVPVVFTSGLATLAQVKATVVAALGRASAPVALVRVESVPQLANGKPDRVGLTEFAATRAGRPGPGR